MPPKRTKFQLTGVPKDVNIDEAVLLALYDFGAFKWPICSRPNHYVVAPFEIALRYSAKHASYYFVTDTKANGGRGDRIVAKQNEKDATIFEFQKYFSSHDDYNTYLKEKEKPSNMPAKPEGRLPSHFLGNMCGGSGDTDGFLAWARARAKKTTEEKEKEKTTGGAAAAKPAAETTQATTVATTAATTVTAAATTAATAGAGAVATSKPQWLEEEEEHPDDPVFWSKDITAINCFRVSDLIPTTPAFGLLDLEVFAQLGCYIVDDTKNDQLAA
jgi:hypothetical protein